MQNSTNNIDKLLQIFSNQKNLVRFFYVGILSNIINFIVYYLTNKFTVNLLLASFLGYFSGLICSYHFARVWVFDFKFLISLNNILFFIIVYLAGLIWMAGIINFMVVNMHLEYKISWIAGAIISATNNFLGLKFLVFKK